LTLTFLVFGSLSLEKDYPFYWFLHRLAIGSETILSYAGLNTYCI
jgi:hypothetical protein